MKPAAAAYGIALDGIELAEACQWVENVIAESACGIMDQAAVGAGRRRIRPALFASRARRGRWSGFPRSAAMLGGGFRRQPRGHRN